MSHGEGAHVIITYSSGYYLGIVALHHTPLHQIHIHDLWIVSIRASAMDRARLQGEIRFLGLVWCRGEFRYRGLGLKGTTNSSWLNTISADIFSPSDLSNWNNKLSKPSDGSRTGSITLAYRSSAGQIKVKFRLIQG